jgi:prepilin-type N-terminal cleavage/methylation domain-containing protein
MRAVRDLPERNRRRPAFTLVELIVVVAIIAVLVGLVASSMFRLISGQRADASEQTIRKVMGTLNPQWQDVLKIAENEPIPPEILNMAGGNQARARVIWKKLRLVQEFPMSFAEALTPYPPTDGQGNKNPYYPLTGVNNTLSSLYAADLAGKGSPGFGEGAICLALALSRQRGGVRLNLDDLGSTVVVDSGIPGLRMIVDNWRIPLSFQRFPIISELDSSNPGKGTLAQTVGRDPLDPQGLLQDPTWNNVNNYNAKLGVYWFEVALHPIHVVIPPYTPQAWYMVPVVSSAGQDKTPGTSDDIMSYNLRTGARGD